MSGFLHLAVLGMAVYRLSAMLATEAGPGRIFERVRKWAGRKNKTAGEGVACPLCESVWWSASAVGMACWLRWFPWEEAALWWLGVSGFAVVLWRQWPK